jgi:hypothetical protein
LGSCEIAYPRDVLADDPDVGAIRRAACAIENGSAADDHVERWRRLRRLRGRNGSNQQAGEKGEPYFPLIHSAIAFPTGPRIIQWRENPKVR